MKKALAFGLWILLGLMLTTKAFADVQCQENVLDTQTLEQKDVNTDVPKFLEGATIIVRLKDGKETAVPAEKFKVVPRKQQFLVTKVQTQSNKFCVVKEEDRKNRVSLMAGRGPDEGLNRTTQNATTVEVESRVGVVGGVMYQRKLGERLSLGAQVQTNKSGLGVVGWDF